MATPGNPVLDRGAARLVGQQRGVRTEQRRHSPMGATRHAHRAERQDDLRTSWSKPSDRGAGSIARPRRSRARAARRPCPGKTAKEAGACPAPRFLLSSRPRSPKGVTPACLPPHPHAVRRNRVPTGRVFQSPAQLPGNGEPARKARTPLLGNDLPSRQLNGRKITHSPVSQKWPIHPPPRAVRYAIPKNNPSLIMKLTLRTRTVPHRSRFTSF